LVLEAAGGNPLIAQNMEIELTGEWWERWMINRSARMKADERKAKRQKLKNGLKD